MPFNSGIDDSPHCPDYTSSGLSHIVRRRKVDCGQHTGRHQNINEAGRKQAITPNVPFLDQDR